MAHESEAYRNAGVDLELGDDLSKMLYEASKLTWKNRQGEFGEPELLNDSFSGKRVISLDRLPSEPGLVMYMGDDGVGTKVEVAERTSDFLTIAHDLFAMVCDDAVVCGADPVLITTTLDVNKLSKDEATQKALKELCIGYVNAAKLAGVAVINGEVAELGDRVAGSGPFNLNWSATVSWFAHRERILDGTKITPGDTVVALREEGFRSNGLSLARKVFSEVRGKNWHETDGITKGKTLGEEVLHPSDIYSRAIVDMVGGYDLLRAPGAEMHGAAHITGGGIPGKLGRLLSSTGYGAQLNNLFYPAGAMRFVEENADIDSEEAYRIWNMGQGMLIVTPEPEAVIEIAEEHGHTAQVCGEITDTPQITIYSRGKSLGEKLTYTLTLL